MAAVAALAAVVSIIAVILTTDALPRLTATLLLFFAVALVAVSLWFRQWEIPLQLLSTVLLGVIAWWAEDRVMVDLALRLVQRAGDLLGGVAPSPEARRGC